MSAIDRYPCRVEFDRYFVEGNLQGITHTDRMGFMSWDDACRWAAEVTESCFVDYVIVSMTNLETGEQVGF